MPTAHSTCAGWPTLVLDWRTGGNGWKTKPTPKCLRLGPPTVAGKATPTVSAEGDVRVNPSAGGPLTITRRCPPGGDHGRPLVAVPAASLPVRVRDARGGFHGATCSMGPPRRRRAGPLSRAQRLRPRVLGAARHGASRRAGPDVTVTAFAEMGSDVAVARDDSKPDSDRGKYRAPRVSTSRRAPAPARCGSDRPHRARRCRSWWRHDRDPVSGPPAPTAAHCPVCCAALDPHQLRLPGLRHRLTGAFRHLRLLPAVR